MASVFRYEASEASRRAPRPSAPPARPSAPPAPPAQDDVAMTLEIPIDDVLETADALAAEPEPAPVYVPQLPLPSFAKPTRSLIVALPPSSPTLPPSSATLPAPSPSAFPPPRASAPPPSTRLSAPPPPRVHASLPTMAPLPAVERAQAPSVAPVAMDVEVAVHLRPPQRRPPPADSTMQIILDLTRVPRRIPQRKLGWVVALAVGVSVVILVVGFVRRATSERDEETRATLATMVAPQKPTATPSNPIAVKPTTPSTAKSEPGNVTPSTVGTVVGPAGRVYIDGKQVRGTSAIIPCGTRNIRVAPSNKTNRVDVPCGGEVKLR